MFNKFAKEQSGLKEGQFLVFTDNVRLFKGKPVLVVGNNKVIFLDLSQVTKAESIPMHVVSDEFGPSLEPVEGESPIYGFIVKLNDFSFSKVYTFRNGFADFCFEKDDTLDSLKKVNAEQDSSMDDISPRGHIKMTAPENSIESL